MKLMGRFSYLYHRTQQRGTRRRPPVSDASAHYLKQENGLKPSLKFIDNTYFKIYFRSRVSAINVTDSLPHSRHIYLYRPYPRFLWIELDIIYDFATSKLILKPFLLVIGVEMVSMEGF